HLKNLELGSGKVLFIRRAEGIGVSEYRIVETGTVNEISSLAQPVRNKDRLEVYIVARHTSNEENGIARIQGFVIDIEGGGKLVGQKVLVEIVEVYRTFARAIPVAKKV
ncbi:MAG: TRAM domain-containing protein, partial [Firmicutes bacterium]|nr:TRAM domain-containing protein [Bacillota bacterium]